MLGEVAFDLNALPNHRVSTLSNTGLLSRVSLGYGSNIQILDRVELYLITQPKFGKFGGDLGTPPEHEVSYVSDPDRW